MPLTITGDKGSELGLLIALITMMRYSNSLFFLSWTYKTLRARFQPFLSEENLPAFKAVKSIYNITRERSWRPLWHKELENIAHIYNLGKASSGYTESDIVHS